MCFLSVNDVWRKKWLFVLYELEERVSTLDRKKAENLMLKLAVRTFVSATGLDYVNSS
jgi:hypothetical protein